MEFRIQFRIDRPLRMICTKSKEGSKQQEYNDENYFALFYFQENKIDHPYQKEQKVRKKNKRGHIDIVTQKKASALSEDHIIKHTDNGSNNSDKERGQSDLGKRSGMNWIHVRDLRG